MEDKSRHRKKGGTTPLVIQHGHAQFTEAGRIKYAWKSIKELWEAWPDSNLESFSRSWGISYSSITKRPEFSVAAKRKQVTLKSGQGSFRERVIRSITLGRGNTSTDPEQMTEIIEALMQCAEAQSKLLRSRMVKMQPDGTTIANACLSNRDLKYLSAALKDTTQSMKELMFLSASVPGIGDESGIKSEPKPEIIGRIGAKTA